jgi:ElaB/YqjD/DUF883 family membrane-anchored ribosome-binding protein
MKILLPAILAFLLIPALHAQNVRFKTYHILDGQDSLPVQGIIATNMTELRKVNLADNSFPIVIMPEEVVEQSIHTINSKTALLGTLQAEKRLFVYRDTLHSLETRKLNDLLKIRQEMFVSCETANVRLNQQINAMNEQMKQSLELTKEYRRGRGMRAFWGVAVGTGIGLGLGTILGLVLAGN